MKLPRILDLRGIVLLTMVGLIALGLTLTDNKRAQPPVSETTPPAPEEAAGTITDPNSTCAEFCGTDVEIGEPFSAVLFEGRGVEYWHWEAVLLERKVVRLERRLQRKWEPTVDYAITLASVVYGVPRWELSSVAECESHKNPFAKNRTSSASGVMQFLPSTWAGSWGAKIFNDAGFSVWDPVANVMAAARMVSREGWSQWACRP